MHYYQFNIGDYSSHTKGLSLLEDLAYRRLLDEYYLHERPLNSGIASVARQIGMRGHEEEVKFVLELFFVLQDCGWINPRADKEIQQYQQRIEQASKAGKASAEHRLNRRATPVEQPLNQPITINQEPITNTDDAYASLSGTVFPTCPQKAIIDLWKKHLPNLPQPRVWEGSRQVNLKNRWIQAGKPSEFSPQGYKTVGDGLKWWGSFFKHIAEDTKLANGFESQGRTWRPDLEWVVNASNFAKIIDGKYDK